ncbi:hypothetical protein [Pseudarthrobacter sp. N5]|uniref:hypothetical protein n=1 Tax=Pseudarthrobacter sp. N5 TaxID=3418416 RepID=UPI003CED800D
MASRRLIITLIALMLVMAQQNLAGATTSDSGDYGGHGGFKGSGLEAGVWVVDPASGEKVPAPPGFVSNDPNQYSYDLQCQVDADTLAIACLPGQLQCPPRAEDGKAGVPVIWKVAPRSITNPTWAEWKPNGNGPACLYDEKPEDLLPRIAARIEQDFKNLPITPASVTAQPSPHTLRGAETNIFADATEQQFDVTILGQRVHLVATPVEYTYSYGDGTTFGPTPMAGGPLPQEEWGQKTRTSHVYGQTGDFPVAVTTSFRGTYSVNGGPALPVPGTGRFASPAQTLQVWRSVTRHYADDCNVNPAGEGCPGWVPPPGEK